MPFRSARRLLAMDVRELFGSTAFLLLLLVAGPLVGISFAAAVRAYAEASGGGGGVAALSSSLSPLDGMLVPTLGAYDLLITFLVPFVAIRLVSSEKSSGALALLLQSPVTFAAKLTSKLLALLLGWLACLVPAVCALLLWRAYGGHLALPETANLLLGHTLRYVLTCSLAIAAAAILESAASAGIAVLSFTIGTWALDFFATGRGDWIAALARYTPAAMLRQFERGLLGAPVGIAALGASALLLFIAAAFLDLRTSATTRIVRVAIAILVATALLAMRSDRSLDVSEDRRNSFSAADERLLRSIAEPVTIRVQLAAEDPRASEYERGVLTKLRRTLRDLRVEYPYAGRSALFENDDQYGTIVYRIGPRKVSSRSTTEEIVLDELETLARMTPPARGESAYPGHPLHAAPRGAAAIFYFVWPLLIIALWALRRR
ncbi:MAG: ABC transporter permease [Acidobacteria bacterium]|nr:ABC transporter permease [Acidobacteriota bacterium]